jgi:PAS domain S-box-containing protein
MSVLWYPTIILLILTLYLLSGATLLLHRLSSRISLLPLVTYLGGIAAALQARSLGSISLPTGDTMMQVSLGSYLLLPVLLLGMLMIYIVHGPVRARNLMVGIIVIAIFIAASQIIPFLYQQIALEQRPFSYEDTIPAARIPLASAATVAIDVAVLIVVYQAISNRRRRFPSQVAGIVALFLALWTDALVFPVLAYLPARQWMVQIPFNLAGKSFAGLTVLPFIYIYQRHISAFFPDKSVLSPRHPLDLFKTRIQLDTRAQYHYTLLRTISRINQLILRVKEPKALLSQSCDLLCQEHNFTLVWIGLVNEKKGSVELLARSGASIHELPQALEISPDNLVHSALLEEVLSQQRAITHPNPSPEGAARWEALQGANFNAFGLFPMRHNQQALGVLGIYAQGEETFFNLDEVDSLQELADDLAYAVVNLRAQQQQSFLSIAAETMRDGLLITDFRGRISYANPEAQAMLGYDLEALQNRRIFDFMPVSEMKNLQKEYLPALRSQGLFTTDIDMATPNGRAYFSVRGALVRNTLGRATHVVISVRDASAQHTYVQRLLTLNHIATQMVQIRDLGDLYQLILCASEELLEADASAILLTENYTGVIVEIHPHMLPEACISHILNNPWKQAPKIRRSMQEPVYIENISNEDEENKGLEFLAQNELQAMMALPILYQERSWGALTIHYKRPRQFDETEIQLGLTVVNNLAIAIHNAQLYESESRQRKLMQALVEATMVLNSSLELEKVLDHILEQTIQVLPCRSVSLMLIEGEQARMARHLHRSPSGKIESLADGPAISLTTPTLQQMMQTGQPLLITDTARNRIWSDLGLTTWIRSYAAAPLQIRQEIIGFLNINSDQPGFFTEDIIPNLAGFANNASAAIHNARLYQELQARTLDLEDRVHERTSALVAAKDRIEAILASVPDAVFVLDEREVLLDANHAGAALLLYAEREHIDLFNPDFLERLKKGAAPDDKTIIEIQERAYQAIASLTPVSENQFGQVIMFRDVTRFHELDQMKTQFVSDVSHELRTPLTSLSLYLDLLANETNPEKRQRFHATLRRETNRLTELIEDLLTISRIESNRVYMSIQPLDVNRVIDNLVIDRIPVAAQNGLTLFCQPYPHLPLALADERLLTQVISNLLTNAINYTLPGGQAAISSALEEDGSSPSRWVKILIKDSGVGVQPDEIEHIFERFYRGSASRQTGAPGTGLGLAISREILNRMGGRITVTSTPGQGSVFTIWLQAVL